MKKILLLSLLFYAAFVQAQTTSIANVGNINALSMQAIKEGNEVKGYYIFYITDKIDKNTNEYLLAIYDNNLKLLKEIKFEDSRELSIVESAFNGTDLIFVFYDMKKNSFDYHIYGADGNKKPYAYNRTFSEDDTKHYSFNGVVSGRFGQSSSTYRIVSSVEGSGFIGITPNKVGKSHAFQVDFFSTHKKKQWTYIPSDPDKISYAGMLGVANKTIFLSVYKLGSILDANPDYYLVGLDLETGKQIFEFKSDATYRLYPMSLSTTNNGKIFIYGEYYSPKAKLLKDKSLGYAFWQIDEKGKILNEKYVSLADDIGRFVNVSSKGKVEGLGYMYLHNLLQTSDGSFFAIVEGFKKSATVGIGTAKLVITDLAFLKFDENFNPKELRIYEKNDNDFNGFGGLFSSAAWLGTLAKVFGGFDYAYTLNSNDGSSFNVCYYDYVRGDNYKGVTFNSVNYNEGKISIDKINTKSDASRSWILPAKQGQVLVVDYYKNAKKLEIHFEKLN